MPNYTTEDIDKAFSQGLINPQERAKLRINVIQQAGQDEGILRKLIGHLSHEVTEGWKSLRMGAAKNVGPDKSIAQMASGNFEAISGALQILSSLQTSIGHTAGESVQDFLLKRGANQNVAAIAATIADVSAQFVGGAGIVKGIKKGASALKAGAEAKTAANNEEIRKGVMQWMEETISADKSKPLSPTAPPNAAGGGDVVKAGQDVPLPGKAGTMQGERKALPAPAIEKAAKILDEAGQAEDVSVGESLAAAYQAVTAYSPAGKVVDRLNGSTEVQRAVKALTPKIYRVSPGDAQAMSQAMKKETDPFTLFNVAIDQSNPRDIRRLAANRINEINKSDVSTYLRSESNVETLQKIGRSEMFPSTIKSLAQGLSAPRGGLDVSRAGDVGVYARARQKFEEGAAKYESSKINLADLQEKAKAANMSINDVLNLQPGEAKTPLQVAEISQPIRQMGDSFIKNVDAAEAGLAKGDYGKFWEALSDFHLMVEAHWPYMFPRQVAGQTLKTYDEPVLSATRFLQQVPKFSSWLGKLKMNTPEEVEANAQLILSEMQKIKAPGEISNFAKRTAETMAQGGDEVLNDPTFRDKASFYFINSLMSATDTQGRNFSGNIVGAPWHYADKVTSSIAAKALNPFLSAEHHIEGGYLSDANTFVSTWAKSLWDASRYAMTRQYDKVYGLIPDEQARSALLTSRYDLKKFANTGTTNPFSGVAGTVIGTPVSIAQAADEISRIAFYRAAAMEQLHHNWISTNSKVPWGEYAEQGMANLPPSIHEYSTRIASEFTWSDSMSAVGKGFSAFRNIIPGTEFIMPFIRTTDRLTAAIYNHSPVLNVLSKRLWDEMRSGDPVVRGEALGRVAWTNIVSAGLFMGMGAKAPDGMNWVTGGGPTDRALAARLRDDKVHLPYTVWTPAGRLPYHNLMPLGGSLGVVADAREIWDELRTPDAEMLWSGVVLAGTRNLFDTSYAKNLADFFSIWDDPSRTSSGWSRMAANLVKGFVEPAIARQVMREIDPTVKESHDFLDELTREIPGYGGPPKRNSMTGEPVMNPPRLLEGTPAGWFLPTSPIQPVSDDFANWIRRYKPKLPEFPRAFAGQNPAQSPFAYGGELGEAKEAMSGIPIPDELRQKGIDYMHSAEDFGKTLNQEANELISSEDFKKLAPIDQVDQVHGLYNSRIGPALGKLKAEHPELLDAYELKMQKRAEVRMPPEERDAFEATVNAPAEVPEASPGLPQLPSFGAEAEAQP